MTPISTCHRCPLRQRPCAGPCPCTVDGADIIQHAKAGYCPHPAGPRFGDGVKPAAWPPPSTSLPVASDDEIQAMLAHPSQQPCCDPPKA
jgi:hypothetical protein